VAIDFHYRLTHFHRHWITSSATIRPPDFSSGDFTAVFSASMRALQQTHILDAHAVRRQRLTQRHASHAAPVQQDPLVV